MAKNKDIPTESSEIIHGEINQDIDEILDYCANRIVEIQSELKRKNKSNGNRVLHKPPED